MARSDPELLRQLLAAEQQLALVRAENHQLRSSVPSSPATSPLITQTSCLLLPSRLLSLRRDTSPPLKAAENAPPAVLSRTKRSSATGSQSARKPSSATRSRSNVVPSPNPNRPPVANRPNSARPPTASRNRQPTSWQDRRAQLPAPPVQPQQPQIRTKLPKNLPQRRFQSISEGVTPKVLPVAFSWPAPCDAGTQWCQEDTQAASSKAPSLRSVDGWGGRVGLVRQLRRWALTRMAVAFGGWAVWAKPKRVLLIKQAVFTAPVTEVTEQQQQDGYSLGAVKLMNLRQQLEQELAVAALKAWRGSLEGLWFVGDVMRRKSLPDTARYHIEIVIELLRTVTERSEDSKQLMTATALCAEQWIGCGHCWMLVRVPGPKHQLEGYSSSAQPVLTSVTPSSSSSRPRRAGDCLGTGSIIGDCLATGEVQSFDGAELTRRFNPMVDRVEAVEGGVSSALCLPIPVNGQTEPQGVLLCVNHDEGFTGHHAFVLGQLMLVLSPLLKRARSCWDAQARLTAHRPAAVCPRGLLSGSKPLAVRLQIVAAAAMQATAAEEVVIWTLDKKGSEISVLSCHRDSIESPTVSRIGLQSTGLAALPGVCAQVARSGKGELMRDAQVSDAWSCEVDAHSCVVSSVGWVMAAAVPAVHGPRHMGMISVRLAHSAAAGFLPLDLEMLEAFAQQVTLACSLHSSAEELDEMNKRVALVKSYMQLRKNSGLSAAPIEETAIALLETIPQWLPCAQLQLVIFDSNNSGQPGQAAIFTPSGDMRKIQLAGIEHSLVTHVASLAKAGGRVTNLFSKPSTQHCDQYNCQVDLPITFAEQQLLSLTLVDHQSNPCAVIQATSLHDVQSQWDNDAVTENGALVCPFLSALLERRNRCQSLARVEGLLQSTLSCVEHIVRPPALIPTQRPNKPQQVIPAMLSQMKKGLGAVSVSLYKVSRQASTAGSLKLMASTHDGKAKSLLTLREPFASELRGGQTVQCATAEVAGHAAGATTAVFVAIHSIEENTEVTAAVEIELDQAPDDLFAAEWYAAVSETSGLLSCLLRSAQWDMPSCFLTKKFKHMSSLLHQVAASTAADSMVPLMQRIRQFLDASMCCVYILRPEEKGHRRSGMKGLEQMMGQDATKYLVMLCGVSEAIAQLYEGARGSIEIPFGNGLLGGCALSMKEVVATLDDDYVGPLIKDKDLPTSSRMLGFSAVPIIDWTNPSAPRVLGVLQALQSDYPVQQDQVHNLKLCASLLLGTGILAKWTEQLTRDHKEDSTPAFNRAYSSI